MKQLLILLVEDDSNAVIFTQRAMKKAGINHQLVVARDGQEAIDYLSQPNKETHPCPDWIVTDLNMARVNGIDLLKWLKKSEVHIIPTIMLSSSNRPSDVKEAYLCGASSYFCKPADFEAAQALWKMVCEYWCEAELPVVREEFCA